MLAAAGSVAGLGNLWVFPYNTGANGGAAFVLLYSACTACTLFTGSITMMCEIFIGRRSHANPVAPYKNTYKFSVDSAFWQL